jgi:hypothetical protein
VYKFGSSISETPFLFSTGNILCDPYTNPNYLVYSMQHVLFKTPDYMRFNGTEWLRYIRQVNPIAFTTSPPINDIKITSFQPYILFAVNAAEMLVMQDATYNINIYVETQDGSPFPVPITLSWYRDRSAFMADVDELYGGIYTQNPYYYFVNETFQDTNSAVITCKTLSKETSYLLVSIASGSTLPGNVPLRIFAVNTDLFSISSVTNALPIDYRKLPYASSAIELVTPMDAAFQDPLTSIFSTAADFFQLGYDDSHISNNVLDWIIQGTNQTHYDPNSIEAFSTNTYTGLRYIFQDPSGAAAAPAPETTSWSLFFPTDTSNKIEDSYTVLYYDTSSFTIKNGSSNEFTLTNWFNSATAKESFWNPLPYGDSNYLMNCSSIQSSVGVFQACINPTYNLQTDMSTNSGAYDSNGLSGVSFFLPPGEVVSMKEVVLKFGYTAPTFTDATLSNPITRNFLYTNTLDYVGSPDWLVNVNSLIAGTPNLIDFGRKPFAIQNTSSGETYIAYVSSQDISGATKTGNPYDIVFAKLDANGSLLWARQNSTFNIAYCTFSPVIGYNIIPKLVISSTGTVYLSLTYTNDFIYTFTQIHVYKFDSSGTVINSASLPPNTSFDYFMEDYVLRIDSEDNLYFLLNTMYSQDLRTHRFLMYKYNSNLIIDPSFSFSFIESYVVLNVAFYYVDMCIDSSNNIILVYTSATPDTGSTMSGAYDIIVKKFNSNGSILWTQENSSFNESGFSNVLPTVTIDSYDNIYIAYTRFYDGTVMCKLDSNGITQWLQRIRTTIYDTFIRIFVINDIIIGVSDTGNYPIQYDVYAGYPNAAIGVTHQISVFYMDTNGQMIWTNNNTNINVPGMQWYTIPQVTADADYAYIAYQTTVISAFTGNVTLVKLPLVYVRPESFAANNSFYTTQSVNPDVQTEFASWDDWYLPNRQNLRIGVYPTAQISSIGIDSLAIESSICTLSLSKITQVNNYTYTQTSIRKRQPEWGTYYTYKFNSTDRTLWAPSTIAMLGTDANWTTTDVPADLVPTYVSAMSSNEGYFETVPNIKNYNGLERNYGLAPSVGFTVATSYSTISNWVSDIPNSYTMVPFYWDNTNSNWKVGSWFGLTYTTTPQLPPVSTIGAAPYYGPPGFMGWTTDFITVSSFVSSVSSFVSSVSSIFTLASTGMTSFKPVYWNAKISFNQMNDGYEPQTDLTAFGGEAGISGELQDTRMFFYENLSTGTDLADIYISTTGYYVYGAEKSANYTARNDNSGYNYLSFLPDLTVRSSLQASTCEYAVHVRGQVPTVQFTTGLRVIGKNYTDFGTVQLAEILNEIQQLQCYVPIPPAAAYSFATSNTAVINQSTYTYQNLINHNNSIRYNPSIGNYFSFDYADSLITFDQQFSVGTATYGVNAVQGYPGVTFSFYNFSTALSSYIGFYNTNFVGFSTIIGIYAEANTQLQAYISTSYNGILPPQFITRTRYTDPLTFSLPFSTTLVTPYITAVDEWGLGWNLGFAKADTPFAVSQTSQTFIRIVGDYLYLQLNESFNMNGISATEPENLSLTRDAMGQNQRYFAKILLNDFGSISRTAVQMPKEFSPAANKFDTLSFQLVDKLGQPVANSDCDSDLTLQVVEERTDLKITNYVAQNVIR